MRNTSASTLIALILSVCCAATTFAENAPAPADSPAPPADATSGPATAQPAEEKKCIFADGSFKENGKAASFVIELRNECEQRMKCTVNAYVVTAMGPTSGKTVMTLAPKSKGAASRKSYVMKIKLASGSANYSHKCTAL